MSGGSLVVVAHALVVVETRTPRLNFLHKCTARFRILPHNILINELHSVRMCIAYS